MTHRWPDWRAQLETIGMSGPKGEERRQKGSLMVPSD